MSPATVSPATVSPATVSPATVSPATVSPATVSPATVSPATVSPATVSARPRRAACATVDVERYVPHALHRGERDWAETNCYVDVWIELLNALGREPLAGLGFTLAIDLEADQWTFVKFPHDEVRRLYGIAVFELNPWTTVLDQTLAELAAGRAVLVEVDAFHLPDTQGTSYRSEHVKTTIAVIELDLDARRMVYAHNQSVHLLGGDDLAALFLDGAAAGERVPAWLPPYVEVAKVTGPGLRGPELAVASFELLRSHVAMAPRENPFPRWGDRLAEEMDRLHASGGSLFHGWSFATCRQFGAAFSLAASHLDWLGGHGDPSCTGLDAGLGAGLDAGLGAAATAFRSISATAKSLQFRAARAAIGGKAFDATTQLATLRDAWDEGMGHLRAGTGH